MHSLKQRWLMSAVLVAGLIGFLAGSGFTDDPAQPSEEEMMKQFMELAKPGPGHKAIEPMIGDFDVDSKMWMSGPDPILSKAKSSSAWVLDGRYVNTSYSGSFKSGEKEMPFDGRGVLAFDNYKKQYQSIWYDSFSTNMLLSTGTASEDGKTITLEGTWDGPMGKMVIKHVYNIVSNDQYTLTGYMSSGEGEQKTMELTFNRKKAVDRCCPPDKSKGPGY